MRALILAPHPDDEVLGAGGVIARLAAAGHDVRVAIVTCGQPPLFDKESVERVRSEARKSHAVLGLAPTRFMEGFPAAGLDTVPAHLLNAALSVEFKEADPDILFIPFGGVIHSDHQIVFTSALVAARPGQGTAIRTILAYETLSETNWYAPPITPGFIPNAWVDISQYLEKKIAAFETYESQVKTFPHERSSEAIRALARFRGATVGVEAAEAFMVIRQVVTDLRTVALNNLLDTTSEKNPAA